MIEQRTRLYCLVPRELAGKLHDPLRRHFAGDPSVEVVVERRNADRRGGDERREDGRAGRPAERRLVRATAGRRAGERRAALVPVEPPVSLPRRARGHAASLTFVERIEPTAEHAEDIDTARLVTRFQAGDKEAFATIYMRYFDRVYSYLRVVFQDQHEAEDMTQQAFSNVLEALPGYERRRQPFRAWLFVVVRNAAVSQLRRSRRLDVVDPTEINRSRERRAELAEDVGALDWLTDRDLVTFIERLPLAQRQVLVLRYMLDLTSAQAAEVLGRSPEDVRILQHRAIRFLRDRLGAMRDRSDRCRERTRARSALRQAVVLRTRRYVLRS